MGTRYFRAENLFANIGTTRYISVVTTTITRIYMSTAYTGIRVYNSGSHTLIYGDSNIAVNSGNFLFPGVSVDFGWVQDNFSFYMLADSANSFVSVLEYN